MTVTTEFEVQLKSNPSVYIDGYVERNDKIGEDVDWYFYDRNNMPSSQFFIEHLDIDGFTGATQKQENEIQDFKIRYEENIEEVSDIILQADFYDTINDPQEIERYSLIIKIEDVSSDCGFDGHDFLCNACNKCGECGFEQWE